MMSRIFLISIGFLVCFSLTSSQPQGVEYWRLHFDQAPAQHAYPASFHGVGEASHFLAERYWHQQQRASALVFYQRAVEQDDPGAAYSLAQRIPAQREQWLRAAAKLQDPRATLIIAEQLRASDPAEAVALLEAIPVSDSRNEMLASVLFNHPHLVTDNDADWQALAPSTNTWQQRRIQALAFSERDSYATRTDAPCQSYMTFYYHGDKARSTVYDWLHEFGQHPFARLGLCFTEATFAQASGYQCTQDQVGRAHCQAIIDSDEDNFHIHVVAAGSANVRANHMAISQQATFDVFIHEMAHLFSLADEYPMRAELAQAFCSGRYRFFPLNLVITPTRPEKLSYQAVVELRESLPWVDYLDQPIAVPILSKALEPMYQPGSPSSAGVGLFKVDTCKGTDYQAWRPVAGTTFMQQHEVGNVPDVYLELMRRYLQAGH